ncbi:hypothetical protein COUCH_20645 [Couchioplanes caeruleus]|uniref:hypothetical protein n=1 Tax=Couchioplanes caeruleus TaxID=56438 RepID=UPI0020C156D3|nr:hypothetical protein [Couchioplanes caeruleus]UQU61470.1 hypothetical protein COUCH_20645 [Couchioplanes caeruleus]
MTRRGITYDTGFRHGDGPSTHEPFGHQAVRRDLRVIREELRCTAVRVTGGDPGRLELAAQAAAEAGLEVWFSPFTSDLTTAGLLGVLADCAERAERLRAGGAEVVMVTGAELTLFTKGFLPGETLEERLALLSRGGLRTEEIRPRLNAFLGEAVAVVRSRFGGRVTYAALPSEQVDWAPFDLVGVDLYRSKETADVYPYAVQSLATFGKPVAITEFGCTTFRGAADLGARGMFIVDWDGATPRALTGGIVRDEQEQVRYLRELLDVFEENGVDHAFWCTFASYNLPGRFDAASYGLVRVAEDGTWEPKAAFAAYAKANSAIAASDGR